jgi:alkylation response protein AidB-like acyl-CoA dehydrogenase
MQFQNQFRDPPSLRALDGSETILAGIRELSPEITARSAAIEAARRIPPDLIDRLKSLGLFRMFVPRSHGGLGLDLPAGLAVISALARIDGAVGWTAMIASGSALFASWAQRETYDRIYRNGPDVPVSGSSQAVGTAEPVVGGWRISGRWPLVSGCMHAEWMAGFCVVTANGNPVFDAQGRPRVRCVVLPAQDWEIEDSWHAAGLKGTGSHHIVLKDSLVSEASLFDLEGGGGPCVPGQLYAAVLHVLPLFHAAFSVGMAEGTLDELAALARTGRQQHQAATTMQESEVFQFELGRTGADVRAARAFLQAQLASHWNHALAGTLNDEALMMEGKQTAVWIASTCVRVADACFALAGTSAVYETSPLQRRLRDLHVAGQHAVAQQRQYVGAGKLPLMRQA